jgi:hypothetical protein
MIGIATQRSSLHEKCLIILTRFLVSLGILSCAFATVPAHAASPSDIATNKNRTAILDLFSKGIIGGYSDGTFKPGNTINRAELAKILVTAKGANPTVDQYNNCFSDVTTEWFAPYVCYAKEQGWVAGYSDGTFRPSNPVNTAESIKMILNAQDVSVSSSTSDNTYSDVDSNAWYASFVETANSKGLLEIARGKLNVNGNMTRGGVAEMIYRALSIKASGAAKFVAAEGTQTSEGGGGQRGNFTPEDLQKYLDEANAASDKVTLTKDQFTSELTTLQQQQMAQMQQQMQQNGSQWNGQPPSGQFSSRQGQFGSAGNRPDPMASASTYLKYTDSSGNEVLLALDASGKVIFKWPSGFGGGRGFPEGQPPSQGN